MAYLSKLLNTKITDSADKVIGRLKDVVIVPKSGEYAPLLFLLVKRNGGHASPAGKEDFFISYDYVENIARDEIALKSPLSAISFQPPAGEYVLLGNDVLDQQIVDVEGARVVRVNDLRLGLFENRMCVLGIDISFKGILRRLGLAGFDVFDVLKVNLIDWRKTQPVKGILKLDTMSKDLIRLHPADLANIIEDLSIKHGSRLVKSLDTETAAKVMEEIEPALQKVLVNRLDPKQAAQIVSRMSTDEIVDLLKLLPKEEASKLISKLANVRFRKAEKLIRYDDDIAGGLMTTDFVSAGPDWTVERTVDEIRRVSPLMRSILYVYVVDAEGVFQGAISLRRLLMADAKDQLADLLKSLSPLPKLKITDHVSHIINFMTKYDLYMSAVVDESGKLVGVVSIDDIMRYLHPEA